MSLWLFYIMWMCVWVQTWRWISIFFCAFEKKKIQRNVYFFWKYFIKKSQQQLEHLYYCGQYVTPSTVSCCVNEARFHHINFYLSNQIQMYFYCISLFYEPKFVMTVCLFKTPHTLQNILDPCEEILQSEKGGNVLSGDSWALIIRRDWYPSSNNI